MQPTLYAACVGSVGWHTSRVPAHGLLGAYSSSFTTLSIMWSQQNWATFMAPILPGSILASHEPPLWAPLCVYAWWTPGLSSSSRSLLHGGSLLPVGPLRCAGA